jgi:HEAT repeat protein
MTHHDPTSARRNDLGRTGVSALALALVLVLALAIPTFAAAQAPKAAAAPAASSQPSLDVILKELAAWDSGVESAAVWKFRDYVYAKKDDAAGRAECETKILAFLKAPGATPMAKMTAARYLRVIAADTAVPALQAMLADERLADMAIYVLGKMPGPAADKALVQALATTAGATKTAVIATLGERRSLAAVSALAPLLKTPAFAAPAVTALGSIGGAEANQALSAALPTSSGELKPTVASAMMQCAEQALASKNADSALKLYDAVFADAALPASIHRAAAVGRITAAGDGAPAALLAFLGGTDAWLQQVAAGKIREVFKPENIGQVCGLMPKLPDLAQVQVLAALSGYPRERVLPTVLGAMKSQSLPVRLAAMKALETVGDESALTLLLETAARARGTEQAAARAALGLLKGPVDVRLMDLLSKSPSAEIEGEVLLAVADRRIYVAKPAVAARLSSTSDRTRVQALRALRAVGTPSDIPAVLDIIMKAEDGPERSEAEATISALAQKVVNSENRAGVLRMRMMTEKDPARRVRLLGVLPLIGDPGSLQVLRQALNDGNAEIHDAAVRALCAWPTPTARDDVFRLARDSRSETHRLLAIQALVRMITIDKNRDPSAAVADLRSAAAFSWRAEEQRLVLGALAQFPSREALELANGFLREPSVKTEAEAAIGEITRRLK